MRHKLLGLFVVIVACLATTFARAEFDGPAKPVPSANVLLNSLGNVQGDVAYRGALGWTVLPPGTAGQAFVTQGANANPTWSGVGTVTSATIAAGTGINVAGTCTFTTTGTCTISQTNVFFPAPGGRLTLQSHTPVMTSTQAAKSTIYYDSYVSGYVPVYNGSNDVVLAIGSNEISTALQSSSTGVINNAGVYDVWGINVSGTLTLCVATNGSGGGWASDTGTPSNMKRGSGYTQLDYSTRSYITNANSITHCYNGATDEGSISANQATYLGTFYSTAAGQTGWVYGVTGNTPTAAVFGVWNAYNRTLAGTTFGDSATNWSYATATTWRQAHNDTTYQVTYVVGIAEDAIDAAYFSAAVSASGAVCLASVGIDTNTAAGPNTAYSSQTSVASPIPAQYSGVPGVGAHVISAIEYVSAVSGCSFEGSAQSAQTTLLWRSMQ